MKIKFRNISVVAVLILLLSIFLSASANAQDKVYIKIEIKGLACPYCAFGMEKELKKVAGVDEVEIELKEGLAYISTPVSQRPSKKELEKIISNAGFTVGQIEFQDVAFQVQKDKKK